MTRALPVDLAAIADADSSARANASLRLLRWSAWGEGWAFGPAEQEARDLDAMMALDAQASGREQLATLASTRLTRAQARAEAMRAAGWSVASARVECFGPVPSLMADAPAGATGFVLDRNLGLPTLPSATVRKLLVAGAHVPPDDTEPAPAALAELAGQQYGDESRLVVFDALPVTPPSMTQTGWDVRWAPDATGEGARGRSVASVARGTEYEFWFASRDGKLVELAASHLEPGLKSLGLAGPPPEPEVVPEPEPEPVPEPAAEAAAEPEPVEAPAAETPVDEAAAQAPAAEPEVAAQEQGPTEVPEDVQTISVRVPSAQYLPNNGRVFVMFVPPDGRDAMKAEEHISAIAMTEELRAKLKKKKVLVQVNVDVEAVGNSWRIRGLAL